jgi:hypothetical protein
MLGDGCPGAPGGATRSKAVTARFLKQFSNYTHKEQAKVTAGAIAALVIVAWLAVIALALLST